MRIWIDAIKGIYFPSRQITNLLGYIENFDENSEFRIGYKMIPCYDASYEGNEL